TGWMTSSSSCFGSIPVLTTAPTTAPAARRSRTGTRTGPTRCCSSPRAACARGPLDRRRSSEPLLDLVEEPLPARRALVVVVGRRLRRRLRRWDHRRQAWLRRLRVREQRAPRPARLGEQVEDSGARVGKLEPRAPEIATARRDP